MENSVEVYSNKADVSNPARKWLYVSLCGLIICVLSLGFHLIRKNTSSTPLPAKVLKQVFGFSPYYFLNNKLPEHTRLDESSPKFFGNALLFNLTASNNEAISISENAMPANYTLKNDQADESFITAHGAATVTNKDGHNIGTLLTDDKTLILARVNDSVSAATIKAVLQAFVPIAKPTATTNSAN